MSNAVSRQPLDAATEMTVAWIQCGSPTKEMAADFFLEMYKTVLKAYTSDTSWRQQLKQELQK